MMAVWLLFLFFAAAFADCKSNSLHLLVDEAKAQLTIGHYNLTTTEQKALFITPQQLIERDHFGAELKNRNLNLVLANKNFTSSSQETLIDGIRVAQKDLHVCLASDSLSCESEPNAKLTIFVFEECDLLATSHYYKHLFVGNSTDLRHVDTPAANLVVLGCNSTLTSSASCPRELNLTNGVTLLGATITASSDMPNMTLANITLTNATIPFNSSIVFYVAPFVSQPSSSSSSSSSSVAETQTDTTDTSGSEKQQEEGTTNEVQMDGRVEEDAVYASYKEAERQLHYFGFEVETRAGDMVDISTWIKFYDTIPALNETVVFGTKKMGTLDARPLESVIVNDTWYFIRSRFFTDVSGMDIVYMHFGQLPVGQKVAFFDLRARLYHEAVPVSKGNIMISFGISHWDWCADCIFGSANPEDGTEAKRMNGSHLDLSFELSTVTITPPPAEFAQDTTEDESENSEREITAQYKYKLSMTRGQGNMGLETNELSNDVDESESVVDVPPVTYSQGSNALAMMEKQTIAYNNHKIWLPSQYYVNGTKQNMVYGFPATLHRDGNQLITVRLTREDNATNYVYTMMVYDAVDQPKAATNDSRALALGLGLGLPLLAFVTALVYWTSCRKEKDPLLSSSNGNGYIFGGIYASLQDNEENPQTPEQGEQADVLALENRRKKKKQPKGSNPEAEKQLDEIEEEEGETFMIEEETTNDEEDGGPMGAVKVSKKKRYV